MRREAHVDAAPSPREESREEARPDAGRSPGSPRARAAGRSSEPVVAPEAPDAPGVPDPTDLAAVVDAYETPLLRYVHHLLGAGRDIDQAEDVVQETFLRLHRYVRKRGPGEVRNLSTWLFRVAHNIVMDTLRGKAAGRKTKEAARLAAERRAAQLEDEGSPEGLAAMVRRAACERAVEELGKLPERQRQVLLLRIIQDMTMREIARVTGISVGNVAYHMNQALAELARRLKAAGVI